MAPQRKNETNRPKASSAKPNRSYKSPAVRKEHKLAKVTGNLKVTGQPQ